MMDDYIRVSHSSKNNLKDVSVCIPCKQLISFIGKSGSGKSTLAVDVIYAAYVNSAANVETFGNASLFKQIATLNNQKGAVVRYLLGYDEEDSVKNKTLSTLKFHVDDILLNEEDIHKIISFLNLSEINVSSTVCTLSMSTYNKIRFLKMLLTKKSDVLIVDELAAGLSYNEALTIGKMFIFLVNKGYTILAIEHSLPVIQQSDYIVELGPDAGTRGGEVLFCGAFSEYIKTERWKSMLLEKNKKLPTHHVSKKKIEVTNINFHGFHNMTVQIPMNSIVNICGRTASGKSSLLDIIYRALDKSADAWKNRYGIDGEILGKNHIRRAYVIDQSPVGKNSMSSIATYSGIMDSIRKIYADASKTYKKDYTVSDFSYNGLHGCKKCSGRGYFSKIIDENEIFLQCDMCTGKRYENDILSIQDCNMSIGDFLQTPCDILHEIYTDNKPHIPVTKKIEFINTVGLSYVCLGQPSGTLSGGESQRLKITKELAKKLGDRCVFILDSPTRGLHVFDCEKMIKVLRNLVEKNNSIVISDNNPFMIRNADYLIFLDNGNISYQGTAKNLPLQYQKDLGIKD